MHEKYHKKVKGFENALRVQRVIGAIVSLLIGALAITLAVEGEFWGSLFALAGMILFWTITKLSIGVGYTLLSIEKNVRVTDKNLTGECNFLEIKDEDIGETTTEQVWSSTQGQAR